MRSWNRSNVSRSSGAPAEKHRRSEREIGAGGPARLGERAEDERDAGEQRDPLTVDGGERGVALEAAGDERGARAHGGEQGVAEPVGVEQRHDGEDHVALVDLDGGPELLGLGDQVGVRAHHPLGCAGRARGEGEQRSGGAVARLVSAGARPGAAAVRAATSSTHGWRAAVEAQSRSAGSDPGSATTAATGAASRCRPSSSTVNCGFTGTAIAPTACTARNVGTKPSSLASTIPTASAGPIPRARNPVEVLDDVRQLAPGQSGAALDEGRAVRDAGDRRRQHRGDGGGAVHGATRVAT